MVRRIDEIAASRLDQPDRSSVIRELIAAALAAHDGEPASRGRRRERQQAPQHVEA
jgi:hypothetical protein